MLNYDFQKKISRIFKVLKFLGIWHMDDGGSRVLNLLYLAYSVAVIVSYNLHNLAQTVNLFSIYDNMELLFSSALITVMDIFTNIKTFVMLKNQRRIRNLYDVLNKPSFQPRNQRQIELVEDTFFLFDICYTVYRIFPSLTVIFWGIYPLLESDEYRKLPFLASYPFDQKQFPLFELTYCHQFISVMYMAHTHVNTDCLLYALMAIGIIQFDILSDNLRNIYETAKSKIEPQFCTESLDLFKNQLEKSLLECIAHHKEILLYFDEVYLMLNLTILGQFVLSTGSLCLTTVQVSATKNLFSVEFAALVCYECSLISQLGLYCWWGNEVMVKSEEVPKAAFESNWRDAPISYQKKLIFFIHRTQIPVVMLAVDFFRLTLQTFTGILRTSYSFYAVLHHVRSREEIV